MTELCPAVQEGIKNIKESISNCREGEYEHTYKNVLEHKLKASEKCAGLQAEWERERVKKAIDVFKSKIGNLDNQKKILFLLNELKKELGIEQEEKEK